ncbi:hypothetical protein E2C01_091679 [Portunus trituberculatus]|uniref:Uncharacterized protein n=1 Tax=Portunus trituberculatus TaxID=210409 RepID=A0A5B7JEK7_PORTR|nr:hypothetical protein [Portunus trituberculatus]
MPAMLSLPPPDTAACVRGREGAWSRAREPSPCSSESYQKIVPGSSPANPLPPSFLPSFPEVRPFPPTTASPPWRALFPLPGCLAHLKLVSTLTGPPRLIISYHMISVMFISKANQHLLSFKSSLTNGVLAVEWPACTLPRCSGTGDPRRGGGCRCYKMAG